MTMLPPEVMEGAAARMLFHTPNTLTVSTPVEDQCWERQEREV